MDAIGAIRVQRSVLEELDPEHDVPREVAFVESFGERMRSIINTFPEKTGKDPTAADIIWCLGYETHEDPHILMRCIVPYNTSNEHHESL